MEFNFTQKMGEMCERLLDAKKDRAVACTTARKERMERIKEISQETHNFLEGFRRDFLQPLKKDMEAAHKVFPRFSKEFAKVH